MFALAASLFHALTDRHPFVFSGNFREGCGLAWSDDDRTKFVRFAEFADRACAPDPKRRFATASEALELLRLLDNPRAAVLAQPNASAALAPLRPMSVSRLNEILKSYPGSRFGNIETRGLELAVRD